MTQQDTDKPHVEQVHEHIRFIGDVLADDLNVSDERREELRSVGRKFAHLPD